MISLSSRVGSISAVHGQGTRPPDASPMGTVHCLWSCRSYESVQEARRHYQHASEPHDRTVSGQGAVWLDWEGRRRGAGMRTRLAGAHRCASMSHPPGAVRTAKLIGEKPTGLAGETLWATAWACWMNQWRKSVSRCRTLETTSQPNVRPVAPSMPKRSRFVSQAPSFDIVAALNSMRQRNQIHNEVVVENIVRKRAFEGTPFRSVFSLTSCDADSVLHSVPDTV